MPRLSRGGLPPTPAGDVRQAECKLIP